MDGYEYGTDIIDAIHLMFEDDRDTEAGCYFQLSGVDDLDISRKATVALYKMGNYCINCGEKMEVYHTREPHPELGPYIYEDFTEYLCPNCDKVTDY